MKTLAQQLLLSLKELALLLWVSPGTLRIWVHRKQRVPDRCAPLIKTLENYRQAMRPQDLAEAQAMLDEYSPLGTIKDYQALQIKQVEVSLYNAQDQLKKLDHQLQKIRRHWHLKHHLSEHFPNEPFDQTQAIEWVNLLGNQAKLAYYDFPHEKYFALQQRIVGLEAQLAFLKAER